MRETVFRGILDAHTDRIHYTNSDFRNFCNVNGAGVIMPVDSSIASSTVDCRELKITTVSVNQQSLSSSGYKPVVPIRSYTSGGKRKNLPRYKKRRCDVHGLTKRQKKEQSS
jgi:hypothetical protein